MRNLYALGIIASLLMIGLAPSPESLFNRFFFILAALFVGYLLLRHQFRLKHYLRLKRAFSKPYHHAQYRWRHKYRNAQIEQLQTA